MAELEPGGETVTEDVDAPVVAPEAETEAQPNDTAADPIETLARDMGWSDKTNWRGDPDAHKDAATFIRDTAKINRNLGQELKGMRETLSGVSRVTESIVADKVAERDAYWQQQHARAVEAGDSDAALEAARNLTAPKPVAPPPPETADFMQRNATWFQKNPLATQRAVEVTEALARAGYSVAEQLTEAEKRVKHEFPDLFPQEAKRPASVAAPTARAATTGTREKGVNDLPPAALAVAKDFQDRHGVSLDVFAKNYWADKAKEKVG